MKAALTWAVRYQQTAEQVAAGETPFYLTYDREQFPQTGYGYCCPCKETKQFPSKSAADGAIKSLGLPTDRHEAIDSETAAKQKKARKKK